MKNIYVCGPTVYSSPHIGNIRPILTFDIYIRALKALGESVNFIHNITDIDDKIIKKAKEQNTTEQAIASKYKEEYLSLLKQFNIVKPDHMPEVLDNMNLITLFIENMVLSNHAYVSEGNVYFDVTSIEQYGEVSNRKLENMIYENEGNKKHPADFALWKRTTEGITFDSPWGKGRPGWHTECSAFVDILTNGQSLDIHGGGIDLLFPHHENESVQYRAKNKKPISKTWKHVGQINLDGEKMSKSIGNIFDAQSFIDKHGADTLRMIFLNSSVTAPLDITEEVISNAKRSLGKFKAVFYKAQLQELANTSVEEIAKELSDWNFAAAMKLINEEVKKFNSLSNNASYIVSIMKLLGFDFTNHELSSGDKQLFRKWEELRKQEEWTEADKLREILKEKELI